MLKSACLAVASAGFILFSSAMPSAAAPAAPGAKSMTPAGSGLVTQVRRGGHHGGHHAGGAIRGGGLRLGGGPAFVGRGYRGGHHHHRRHRGWGGVYFAAPLYYGDYGYGYGDCHWLKRKAWRTGSSYWWRRYNRCVDRSYW